MIVRLWKVKVDPDRIEQYALWEITRSLPMFKKLRGCLGVFFLRSKEHCLALSMWQDMAAVHALKDCELYINTSRDYEQSGMLIGEPELQVFEAIAGFTWSDALRAAAPA
jgi:heme-degrading monooxygenase HmoA